MADLQNFGSFTIGDAMEVLIEGWYSEGIVSSIQADGTYRVKFPGNNIWNSVRMPLF